MLYDDIWKLRDLLDSGAISTDEYMGYSTTIASSERNKKAETMEIRVRQLKSKGVHIPSYPNDSRESILKDLIWHQDHASRGELEDFLYNEHPRRVKAVEQYEKFKKIFSLTDEQFEIICMMDKDSIEKMIEDGIDTKTTEIINSAISR